MPQEKIAYISGNGYHHGVDLSAGIAVKKAVRYNAEQDTSWKFHDLAKELYTWSDLLISNLVDPVARPGVERMPSPVIGFESIDIRTLAYYRLNKNPMGMDDEVILNEKHLERPKYSILETLVHELGHLYQQRRGEHPYKAGSNTHNAEFISRCESIGLHPFPVIGYHWKPADGAFEALLRQHGILKPPETTEVSDPKKERRNWWEEPKDRKGKSTLIKWECKDYSVRSGRMDLDLTCGKCGQKLLPVLPQVRTP